MSRTTQTAVKRIIDVDTAVNLTPFIDTASELVTEVCESLGTYSEDRLELIERWLAAHFYAIFDQQNQLTGEKTGPVSAQYGQNVGVGLKYTRWGHQVLLLDTAGGFAALNANAEKGARVQRNITFLGTADE